MSRHPTLAVWWRMLLLWVGALLAWPSWAWEPSAALGRAVQRGQLIVGVKTDFPPFGQLDAQGVPQGLEVDLAQSLAQALGLNVRVVSVSTENRFQKLEQGDVDVLIATAADTEERRQVATAIEPNYYAGGVTVFLRPEQRAQEWSALKGQKICASQGAYFNRPMQERYLLDLAMYRSTRDALLALRDGRCVGYLYASAAVQAYLKKEEWAGYKAPLPPALVAPWAVFVARKERGTELEQRVGDVVAQWHRSGFLLERERAWGVQVNPFLEQAHQLWKQTTPGGVPLCQRDAQGQWPSACRNPAFVRSHDVSGLQSWGLWLREKLGLNLSFAYDPFDRAVFLRGLAYSFLLMAACVFTSLGCGAVAAWSVEHGRWGVGTLLRTLAVFGRMTPPLLQMYLLYFGIGTLLYAAWGIRIDAFAVAVVCLSYYTGATVMTILLDAAQHRREREPEFGLTWRNMGHVMELTAGPIKASLTNVLKQSVMASALAVPELLSATVSIIADQGNMTVMMNTFMLSFLALISFWMWAFDRLEQQLRRWSGL